MSSNRGGLRVKEKEMREEITVFEMKEKQRGPQIVFLWTQWSPLGRVLSPQVLWASANLNFSLKRGAKSPVSYLDSTSKNHCQYLLVHLSPFLGHTLACCLCGCWCLRYCPSDIIRALAMSLTMQSCLRMEELFTVSLFLFDFIWRAARLKLKEASL